MTRSILFLTALVALFGCERTVYVSPAYVSPAPLVDPPDDGAVQANEVDDADVDTARDEDGNEQRAEQPPGFYFVLSHEPPFVVLRARTDAAWGRGPLVLAQREWPTIVTRDVDEAALPDEVHAALRERVVMRDAEGRACTATLGAPRLLRRVDPDDGRAYEWSGEDGGDRASDERVAAEAWELAAGHELLVAEATVVAGGCERPRWAHPEGAAIDLGAAGRAVPRARALAAFRGLEQHADLQREWREVAPGERGRHWDARPDGHRAIRTFQARSGRRFVVVSALAEDGCGEFTGGLWSLFEARGDRLALVRTAHTFVVPITLADVDGDGLPEVIFPDRIEQADDARTVDVSTPFFGCPC